VVYFCHDGNGKVLMAKRSRNTRDEQGRWDIGGGGVEFGDDIVERVKIEILEEYNVKFLEAEFLGYRNVHREHEGQKTHWIALDFKVLVDPEGVKINEPHKFDDLDWFTLDSLPSPLHSQLPIFLEKYRGKL
jgi:8-oxo-dGTP pyrophosphatase MutT (NUDIX family)